MSYQGKLKFITNPPLGSDLYNELYNERVHPVGDQVRITEDSRIRLTEDGKIRLTE